MRNESAALYPYSFAHGNGIQVLNGAAVGNYNVQNPNDLFQVGNGSSSTSRSNAFRVTKDGTAFACVNIPMFPAEQCTQNSTIQWHRTGRGVDIFIFPYSCLISL